MNKFIAAMDVLRLAVGICSAGALMISPAEADNLPPQVTLVWPTAAGEWWNRTFSAGTLVRLTAAAADRDGSIAEVRFYNATNLIGIATSPPFAVLWSARLPTPLGEYPRLTAVARDNLGATAESEPVSIDILSGPPPTAVVEITSPEPGKTLLTTDNFAFTAELRSAYLPAGPIEFYIGSNRVAVVDQSGSISALYPPPASIVVSNLLEGEYDLHIGYPRGDLCLSCLETTNRIRVVRIAVEVPSRQNGEPFQFDVITSFTNRPNVIERSVDLQEWTAIATNRPSTNRFRYMDSSRPRTSQMFYRVVVPPE